MIILFIGNVNMMSEMIDLYMYYDCEIMYVDDCMFENIYVSGYVIKYKFVYFY